MLFYSMNLLILGTIGWIAINDLHIGKVPPKGLYILGLQIIILKLCLGQSVITVSILISICVIFFIGFIFAWFNALGMGDVKLLVVMALWYSEYEIATIIYLACILGGILALIIGCYRRTRKVRMPFVPAIFIANVIVYVVGIWNICGI